MGSQDVRVTGEGMMWTMRVRHGSRWVCYLTTPDVFLAIRTARRWGW